MWELPGVPDVIEGNALEFPDIKDGWFAGKCPNMPGGGAVGVEGDGKFGG